MERARSPRGVSRLVVRSSAAGDVCGSAAILVGGQGCARKSKREGGGEKEREERKEEEGGGYANGRELKAAGVRPVCRGALRRRLAAAPVGEPPRNDDISYSGAPL